MPVFEAARTGLLWDATAVPNAFFCEYMPSAPENHVKVYLYGLMCAHSGMTEEEGMLDEMARALSLSREDVERAMRYWERCRLVERVQDQPPLYRFQSVQQVMLQRQQLPRDDAYETFAQSVYAIFGEKRKLHGGETVLAFEWVEQYHLPAEVVLMLLQHMKETRGLHFAFKEAQKVAMELCEQHVSTLEEAEEIFDRSEAAMKGSRKILSHLGLRRNPSMDEMALYLKWTREWGFEPAAIREACKATVKGTPNFAYLDKVLENIYQGTQGRATSESAVQRAMEESQQETERTRELLRTLGISMAVIDEGCRAEYRRMAEKNGHELVMLAAREVVRRSRTHTLDMVEKYLNGWAEKGLTTVSAVNAYLAELEACNAEIRTLMDIAGASGGCTKANRDLYAQWQQWQLPRELILLAAEFARGKEKPMPYMHKLLSGWRESGAATAAEARAEHERRQHAPASAAPAQGKRVIEQQYEQRSYADGELDGIPEELLKEMKKA